MANQEDQDDNQETDATESAILAWQSPESVHYNKSSVWFAVVVVIAIVLGGLFFWLKVTSGALAVIAGALAYIVFASVKPKNLKCALYAEGFVIENRAFRYDQFKSFGLINGDMMKVRLKMSGRFAGEVTLPLGNVNIDIVRSQLKKHLPEDKETGEDLTDILSRLTKF